MLEFNENTPKQIIYNIYSKNHLLATLEIYLRIKFIEYNNETLFLNVNKNIIVRTNIIIFLDIDTFNNLTKRYDDITYCHNHNGMRDHFKKFLKNEKKLKFLKHIINIDKTLFLKVSKYQYKHPNDKLSPLTLTSTNALLFNNLLYKNVFLSKNIGIEI